MYYATEKRYSNHAEERLKGIQSDIQYCREKIEIIRTSLTKTNVELTHDRIQSSPNPNRMLNGIACIVELENELSRLTKEGIEFINHLDSEQMRKACILFYIENHKVLDIARIMNYSWAYIYELLNKATNQLAELN